MSKTDISSNFETLDQYRDALEFRAALEWGLGLLMLDRANPRTLRAMRTWLTENGGKIAFDLDHGTVEFTTIPDHLYVLTPKGQVLEDVTVEEIDTGSADPPFRLGNWCVH